MDPAELQRRIAAFPYWYHRIELPDQVCTPGWAPHDAGAYRIPERLDGQRVLDVGAWDGYWTFEALKRGAKQAVAIDDFSDFLGRLAESDRKAWDTFDLCREALGYSEEQADRVEMSVYGVAEETVGRFDTIFCFGLLYHVRHPLLVLDQLAQVCDGDIFIESAILDDFSPYHGGLGNGYPSGQMVMEFYPGSEYGGNDSNWWVPTLECLSKMVLAAGFDTVSAWKLLDPPTHVSNCRGFVHGRKAR